MENLKEEIQRMKSLMAEERLYGSLVDKVETEDDKLIAEWKFIESLMDEEILLTEQFQTIRQLFRRNPKKIDKLGDVEIGGTKIFKGFEKSGLNMATIENMMDLRSLLMKNKKTFLQAMKNNKRWAGLSEKDVDNFIALLYKMDKNPSKYINWDGKPIRLNLSKSGIPAKQKRMITELEGELLDMITQNLIKKGAVQKIKEFSGKIKGKVGSGYDWMKQKISSFFNALKKTTVSGVKFLKSALKKKPIKTTKPVKANKLSGKAIIDECVEAIKNGNYKKLSGSEEAAISRLQVNTILKHITKDGRKTLTDNGFFLSKNPNTGKWNRVDKIEIVGLDGKQVNVPIGKSDIVPTWLENATKKMPDGNNNGVKPTPPKKGGSKIKPPEGDNISKTSWFKSLNGKKIMNGLAKGLQYPFPALSTIIRVARNQEGALNVIGHQGKKRQFLSGYYDRSSKAWDKLVGLGKNTPELIVRAEIEHFIYVTGYLSWQGWPTPEGEPDLSRGEKFMVILGRWGKNHVVVAEKSWGIIKSIGAWFKTEKGYCLSKYDGDRTNPAYKECIVEMKEKKAQLDQYMKDLKLVGKYATNQEGMCEDGEYEKALKRINTTYDDTKQNFLKSKDMGLLIKAVTTVTGVNLSENVSGDDLWKTMNGGVDDETFKSTMTERMNIYNEYCLSQNKNNNPDPNKSKEENKKQQNNQQQNNQQDTQLDNEGNIGYIDIDLDEFIIEGARTPLASMNVCVMEINPLDLVSDEDLT